jgi:hypothetical protein
MAIAAALYIVLGMGALIYARIHNFPHIPYARYLAGAVASIIILLKPERTIELPHLSKWAAWTLSVLVCFSVFVFSRAIFMMLTGH